MKPKLLLIDDNEDLVKVLGHLFNHHQEKENLPECEFFSDVKKFLKAVTPEVQICVIDYFLGDITGLEIIRKVTAINPNSWFIMFSGQQDIKVIAEFMNNTQGSRYVDKGSSEAVELLLFFIKDITQRISTIENYFYQSFKNKISLGELKEQLIDLKKTI